MLTRELYFFALNQMTKLVFTFQSKKRKWNIKNHAVFIQILYTILMKSISLA